MSAAVTVPKVRDNLRGLLIPIGVWVAFRGGRVLCKSFQQAARLVPFEVPLPTEISMELLSRPVR